MGRLSMLVVDDDPVILRLLEVNFQLEGIDVTTATRAAEGWGGAPSGAIAPLVAMPRPVAPTAPVRSLQSAKEKLAEPPAVSSTYEIVSLPKVRAFGVHSQHGQVRALHRQPGDHQDGRAERDEKRRQRDGQRGPPEL